VNGKKQIILISHYRKAVTYSDVLQYVRNTSIFFT